MCMYSADNVSRSSNYCFVDEEFMTYFRLAITIAL